MNYPCRYAIVRFKPYAETGEFANVGVVLFSARGRFFGYKLLEQGTRRISSFFDELDIGVFRHARFLFSSELQRIQRAAELAFNSHGLTAAEADFADRVFDELTRGREAAMHLTPGRAVLAADPAAKLSELFEYYVGRSFTRRPQHEREVTRHVLRILERQQLAPLFRQETLGKPSFQVRFPLVHMKDKKAIKAIKPLPLDHPVPAKLYEYGWEWAGRVRKLKHDGQLPDQVLFAIRPPQEKAGARASACAEIIEELRRDEVTVVADTEEEKILEFARA